MDARIKSLYVFFGNTGEIPLNATHHHFIECIKLQLTCEKQGFTIYDVFDLLKPYLISK